MYCLGRLRQCAIPHNQCISDPIYNACQDCQISCPHMSSGQPPLKVSYIKFNPYVFYISYKMLHSAFIFIQNIIDSVDVSAVPADSSMCCNITTGYPPLFESVTSQFIPYQPPNIFFCFFSQSQQPIIATRH